VVEEFWEVSAAAIGREVPVARGGDEGQLSGTCSTVWIAGSPHVPVMALMGWDVDATLVLGT
jgi:hypothetical protein